MLPDRVSNPGPLTYESGALPIALRGPAILKCFRGSLRLRDNASGLYFQCLLVTLTLLQRMLVGCFGFNGP